MEGVVLEHFIFLNNPPYLCHNFILVYLIKVIRMLALLRHILVFFFNLFLQKKGHLHSWQPCGITQMVAQSSIVVHQVFTYDHLLHYNISIIIEWEVGAPGHEKYMVDDLNAREKCMLNNEMENILKPKLIWYDLHFSSSCRFMKMKKRKL